MATEPKYTLVGPVGNLITPPQPMTGKTLREFALQLIQDDESNAVWREKVEKDEIDSVIEWLTNAGYTVTTV